MKFLNKDVVILVLIDWRECHESGRYKNHQTGNEEPGKRMEAIRSIASIPSASIHTRTIFTLISWSLNIRAVVV